jgi:hypothetical protein
MSIYWRVNKFLKECHIVTRLLKSEHHFCKFMTLMTFHFWKRLSSLLCYSVSGNANSMVQTYTQFIIIIRHPDGRFGVVVAILAYYARGRGFNSRIMQTIVCINMSVFIGSGSYYVYYVCIYKKKVYISIY